MSAGPESPSTTEQMCDCDECRRRRFPLPSPYEVRITLGHKDDKYLYVDHLFEQWPELETVKAVRDEAFSWYHELFGEETDEVMVSVVRVLEA